jgi:hypothetical protein
MAQSNFFPGRPNLMHRKVEMTRDLCFDKMESRGGSVINKTTKKT